MKKGFIKSLSVIAFILSAIFTIMLMTSSSVGIVSCLLVGAMAIVLELSKCLFMLTGFTNTITSHSTIKGISVGISVLLVMFSIVASLSFLQNETNLIKNKAFKASEGYQNQVGARNTASKMMTNVESEIARLQSESAGEVAKLEAQRDDAKAKNWISTKGVGVNAINDKISSARDKYNGLIDSQNSKLEGYAGKASEGIDASQVSVSAVKGYTAFLDTVAGWISTEDTPISSAGLELVLFSLMSIVFEVVAVLLFVLGMSDELAVSSSSYSSTKQKGSNKPQLTTAAIYDSERTIGFRPSQGKSLTDVGHTEVIDANEYGCLDKNQVRAYLVKAEESKKGNGGEIAGVRVLSKACNINEHVGRKISGYLQYLGVIKVETTRSFLIKTQAEYSRILGL